MKLTDYEYSILDEGRRDEIVSQLEDGENYKKLVKEIQELSLRNISGRRSFCKTTLTGIKNIHDLEQFETKDDEDWNDWNVNWLVATLQELWSKPTIRKILEDNFESN